MKNVHLLPTDKPSRLRIGDNGNFVFGMIQTSIQSRNNDFTNQHIYITSDEEIKEGDWFMSDFNSFPIHNIKELSEREGTLGWKQEDLKNNLKIILTTDQDLIKDGVQAIPDDFLEWFVKNPSCEEVGVEQLPLFKKPVYKIVIPQEEPKQESHICKYCDAETTQPDDECYAKPAQYPLEDFIRRESKSGNESVGILKGVIWQSERMYSEEEVKEILMKTDRFLRADLDLWFEQFKKK